MEKDNYKIYSFIIISLVVGLVVFAIISIVYTALESGNVYFDIKSSGLVAFVKYYQHQLSILGISVLLFTVWVTFERMRQTNKQIRIISENNRFTNYNYHQEKFVEDLSSDPVINELHRAGRMDQELLIKRLYYHFYYETYSNFSPELNDDAIQQKEFISTLIQSFIRDHIVEFTDVDRNILLNVNKIFDNSKYAVLINSFTEDIIKLRPEPEEVKLRIKAALNFYYLIHFNKSVLSRIGEPIENSEKIKILLKNYLANFQLKNSFGII